MAANIKQTRWGLALFAGIAAASAAYLMARTYFGQASERDHRVARQLILYYTLSRVDDPIVVLGDSIVEASTLPQNLCGHPVIDAGLNAASTASDLGTWLARALGNKRSSSIVVALGINDALVPKPSSKQAFEERYGELLTQLSKLTTRLFVLAIPPVETRERMTEEMRKEVTATIDTFNSALSGLAQRANATFLPLPEMPSPHTIDGVHLNADGYRIWNKAIVEGAFAGCD